jgi:hypothetical protein
MGWDRVKGIRSKNAYERKRWFLEEIVSLLSRLKESQVN